MPICEKNLFSEENRKKVYAYENKNQSTTETIREVF